MKNYTFTLIGFVLSVILWIVILTLDLDFFEGLAKLFNRLETFELDELIFPVLLFVTFYHVDRIKMQRQTQIEAEKTKIYKAMLVANQHILNNFLNEMQIFKLTADETNGFPKDVIILYQEIIKNTKHQIEELSHIDCINEESINKAILEGLSTDHMFAN